jgi:hypothetical protein
MDKVQVLVDLKLSGVLLFLCSESVLYICIVSDLMVAAERYEGR